MSTVERHPLTGRISSVSFDERFLGASWEWFRDPELRRVMNTPDFSRDEQRQWFEGLKERPSYWLWGVELDGVPVAVFGFKNLTEDGSAEWFMYVGTAQFRGMGIGDWIEHEVVTRGRQQGVRRLWGTVFPENEAVLRLHRRHGFNIGNVEADGMLRVSKEI